MLASYGLLRVLLRDLVCLGGDELYELNAAFDEQIPGFSGKSRTRL